MRQALIGSLVLLLGAAIAWLAWPRAEHADGLDAGPTEAEASPPPASLAAVPIEPPASEPATPVPAPERVELPVDLPGPAGPGTGRVVGTVRYQDDRQPLADVVVRLDAALSIGHLVRAPSLRTDASGGFVFDRVPVRSYTLTCALGGSRQVVVQAGEETRVELLVPRGVSVRGVVLDDGGQPVAGAGIWLSDASVMDFGEIVAKTDGRGAFRIDDVLGTRWVSARARGFANSALSLLDGRQDASRRLEILLVRNDARVRGFVRDPDGRPCAGAAVLASPPGDAKWQRGLDGTNQRAWAPGAATTGADGAFTVEGLPPGPLLVRAHAPGFGKATATLEVTAGGVADVVLALERAACVQGHVRSADGAPARVLLVFARGDVDACWVQSDEDGAYRAAEVSPGEVEVEAWQGRSRALASKLQLAPGETRTWDPVLGRAGALSGRVVDARQQPLADFVVVALRDGRGLGEARADEQGRFTFGDLPAETLTLRVGVQPRGGSNRTRLTVLVVPDVVPPRHDLELVVPDDRLPSVTVSGRVLRADGAPGAGAVLQLGGTDDRGLAEAVADAQGRFELAQLLPGTYWISVNHSEHPVLWAGQRTFAARDVVDLGELRLGAGGRVVVTPRFAPGVTPSELGVEVLDREGRAVAGLQTTGAVLRSPVIPTGQVTLVVSGRSIARARHEVTVEQDRELHVELLVEAGLRRTLRALLPADAPAPRWVWGTAFGGDREMLGGFPFTRGQDGIWTAELWLPARDCLIMAGAEGMKVRGQLTVPASTPDGAVFDVTLSAR